MFIYIYIIHTYAAESCDAGRASHLVGAARRSRLCGLGAAAPCVVQEPGTSIRDLTDPPHPHPRNCLSIRPLDLLTNSYTIIKQGVVRVGWVCVVTKYGR